MQIFEFCNSALFFPQQKRETCRSDNYLSTSRNTRRCSGFYKKLRNSRNKLWHCIKIIIICKGFYHLPLDRPLGGLQNRSSRCGEEKHLAPAGNPSPAVQPVARRDATDTGVIRMECTPVHIFHFNFVFICIIYAGLLLTT
jgi:hypothetical protein